MVGQKQDNEAGGAFDLHPSLRSLAETRVQNLSALQKLRILSIQSNRIVKLEGLENLKELEELYISHNGLERLEGLDNNVRSTASDLLSALTHRKLDNRHNLQLSTLGATESPR